jgi:hypothetical protein
MNMFGGAPKPQIPPPIPQVDNTTAMQDSADRAARRRRQSTVLTSANGLPNLGSTSQASAGGG